MNNEITVKELPAHWHWVKMDNVCDFVRGVNFDKSEVSGSPEEGKIPILRAGNIGARLDTTNDLVWVPKRNVSGDQLLRVGDIAICMSSGSADVVGKTAYVGVEWVGAVGAFCGIVRPRNGLSSFFVNMWFRSQQFLDWRDKQARGANIQNLRFSQLAKLTIPLPPLPTQRRIAEELKAQLAEVDRARAALQAQLETIDALLNATLRDSLAHGATVQARISDCMQEVSQGIGSTWNAYPVLGATRAGLAPAKEPVGKAPERYKPVRVGTVFYNPMRILLGSIAMVDEGDAPGITSPDYVVMTARDGVLHPRWFYHWFRSEAGAAFVRSLTRGAVRERLLFKRLAPAEIPLPPWSAQARAAEVFLAVAVIRKQTLTRIATLNRLPAALLRQVFGEATPAQETT